MLVHELDCSPAELMDALVSEITQRPNRNKNDFRRGHACSLAETGLIGGNKSVKSDDFCDGFIRAMKAVGIFQSHKVSRHLSDVGTRNGYFHRRAPGNFHKPKCISLDRVGPRDTPARQE